MQRNKKTFSILLAFVFIALAFTSLYAAPKKPLTGKKNVKEAVKTKQAANPDIRGIINSSLEALNGRLDALKLDNSDAKVSGLIYFAYSKPLLNGIGPNAFDITRVYMNFKEKLSADASVRVTMDVDRSTIGRNLFDFLKFAYVDMPLNIPQSLKVIPFSVIVKAGLQQTAWIDYDESVWNNRYIMKTFLDNEGIMSSSDFGVGATGAFTLFNLPQVQYLATLNNGAGYKSAETNSEKDIAIRFNSTLWGSDALGRLTFAAMASMKNQLVATTTNTHQGAFEVSFSNSAYGTAYAEYVKGNLLDSTNVQRPIEGSSIGGYLYPLPSKLPGVALIAREDYYNSNTASNGSSVINRTLYGVSYDYGKNLKFAINVQNMQAGGGPIQSILYVNNQVSF